MKLWHCEAARSLRPLWALEEMGLDFELTTMPFPPRYAHPGFKELNPLGTIPYFTDGDVVMTESTAICLYLVEKYERYEFGLEKDHPEYADYLNWLFQSDATFTFPQAIYLRYSRFETKERQSPQVAEDYRKWYLARLRWLDAHIESREYLCAARFTIADMAVGYALYLGHAMLKIGDDYSPQVKDYLARLEQRPAFQRAVAYRVDTG